MRVSFYGIKSSSLQARKAPQPVEVDMKRLRKGVMESTFAQEAF